MHISEIFEDYLSIEKILADNNKLYNKIYLYLWSIKIIQFYYSHKLKQKIFYNDISTILNTYSDDFYYKFSEISLSKLNGNKRMLLTTIIPTIYPRRIKKITNLSMNIYSPILVYNIDLTNIYIICYISNNIYGIINCITGNILEIVCNSEEDFYNKINDNIINFTILNNTYFCTYNFTTNSNSLLNTKI